MVAGMRTQAVLLVFALAACRHEAKSEVPFVTSPTIHVDELPKLDGKSLEEKGSKGPGLLQTEGRIGTLKGTVAVALGEATFQGAMGKLEISVVQGTVRGYFRDGKKGYLYIEATPGKPAGATGEFIYWGGEYATRLQAVDGDATGVTYRTSR
jgi:hypothetical protein